MISSRVLKIIREKSFADPFAEAFDAHKLKEAFGGELNQQELDVLKFTVICSKISADVEREVFKMFDALNMNQEDLVEYLFILVNNQYFNVILKVVNKAKIQGVFDSEGVKYSKIKQSNGESVSARSAIEVGPDILSVLLFLSQKWEPKTKMVRSILEVLNHSREFQFLWLVSSVFLNIKGSAYDLVKYENAEVVFREDGSIKIEKGIGFNPLIITTGSSRADNATTEVLLQSISYYNDSFRHEPGAKAFLVSNNVLTLLKGKSDPSRKARAESSLFVFYPEFSSEIIEYFGGLKLLDLLSLLVLVEECIDELLSVYSGNVEGIEYSKVPIKFLKVDLVDSLKNISNFNEDVISKFIDSISTGADNSYFWRSPFVEIGEYLYFAISAIAYPNHTLFIDKWLSDSGYTIKDKENRFKNYVVSQIDDLQKDGFQFKVVRPDLFGLSEKEFEGSILVQTEIFIIILEVVAFDFPIESSELSSSVNEIEKKVISVTAKSKLIDAVNGSSKKILKLILTKYGSFSGMQIKGVSVVDYTLLSNYVNIGMFKRAAVTFNDGKPVKVDAGSISYYENEAQFNGNLENFFARPVPVYAILDRLYLKEQQIIPAIVNLSIFIDVVDHLSSREILDKQIRTLQESIDFEYFHEPQEISVKGALDQSILYYFNQIFSQLSAAPYESYSDRVRLYQNLSERKEVGFAHLAYYILDCLGKLDGKAIVKTSRFDSCSYKLEEITEIISSSGLFSGGIQLSKFEIHSEAFTIEEEIKLLSFSINALSEVTPGATGEDMLDVFMLPLALMVGLWDRHEVNYEFYAGCANIIDSLNFGHHYQSARDFCEEILLVSINNGTHAQGWGTLFNCYTNQKSNFDSSIYGSLFLTSLSVSPAVPDHLIVTAIYSALKYFRNFGFYEFAKHIYQNLKQFDLSAYDHQKVTLTYYYSLLRSDYLKSDLAPGELLKYPERKFDQIASFGSNGIIPWLTFLYNVRRFENAGRLDYGSRLSSLISKFEADLSDDIVEPIRELFIEGNRSPKEIFIEAILNAFETRSINDFVYESKNLAVVASNLIQYSIRVNDVEGLLLAGFVINDQSYTFKGEEVEVGDVLRIRKSKNIELEKKLNNYRQYVKSKIVLLRGQFLLWLFEDLGRVYVLTIGLENEIDVVELSDWDIGKMTFFIRNMDTFSFNSKKGLFNNPRNVSSYGYEEQRLDLLNLEEFLTFAKVVIPDSAEEILFCSSIELASFPHGLLKIGSNLLSSRIPISNIISIDRFIEKCQTIKINTGYKASAWIPIDDMEPAISWGYELLSDYLETMNCQIYTSTYPDERISTDLNIFLAHGVTSGTGFRAIYTNPGNYKVIEFPSVVFGSGKIAILFICNSGSAQSDFSSNSMVTFSGELLKSGYESVIAPFWPFDVTMSKIWLNEFVDSFNEGFSVSEAVWLANRKLTKYDNYSSNMFYAPAGCLAMHLYGNPNVFVA